MTIGHITRGESWSPLLSIFPDSELRTQSAVNTSLSTGTLAGELYCNGALVASPAVTFVSGNQVNAYLTAAETAALPTPTEVITVGIGEDQYEVRGSRCCLRITVDDNGDIWGVGYDDQSRVEVVVKDPGC